MGNAFREFCNFDNDDGRIEILVKLKRMNTEEPVSKNTNPVNYLLLMIC